MSCDLSTVEYPLRRRLWRGSPIAALAARLGDLARLLRDWRHRRLLAALTEDQLRDLGLARGDVMRELLRPVWEPVDWKELERIRHRRARTELEAGMRPRPHRWRKPPEHKNQERRR